MLWPLLSLPSKPNVQHLSVDRVALYWKLCCERTSLFEKKRFELSAKMVPISLSFLSSWVVLYRIACMMHHTDAVYRYRRRSVVYMYVFVAKSVNNHSHRTVVRECCKGDDKSQWERGKFDPPLPPNPLTNGRQNLCR